MKVECGAKRQYGSLLYKFISHRALERMQFIPVIIFLCKLRHKTFYSCACYHTLSAFLSFYAI